MKSYRYNLRRRSPKMCSLHSCCSSCPWNLGWHTQIRSVTAFHITCHVERFSPCMCEALRFKKTVDSDNISRSVFAQTIFVGSEPFSKCTGYIDAYWLQGPQSDVRISFWGVWLPPIAIEVMQNTIWCEINGWTKSHFSFLLCIFWSMFEQKHFAETPRFLWCARQICRNRFVSCVFFWNANFHFEHICPRSFGVGSWKF